MNEQKHEEDCPSRMIRARWFLGDRCFNESWANADSEKDMEWLEHFKRDAARSIHPAARLVVDSYIFECGDTILPESPMPLSEVVG